MKLIARCSIFAGEAGRIKPGESFEIDDLNGAQLIGRGAAIPAEPEPDPGPAQPAETPPPEPPVKRPPGRQPKAKPHAT